MSEVCLFCAFGYWVSLAVLSPRRFGGPLLHAVPFWGLVSRWLAAGVRCESSVLGGTSRRLLLRWALCLIPPTARSA